VHPQHTKCTPQKEQESILGEFLVGVGDLRLVLLDRILRATTKKVVNFFDEQSAPPYKILATPV